MKLIPAVLRAAALATAAAEASSHAASGGGPRSIIRDQELHQHIVTWDEQSLFIRGERVMLWSGEVHAFRIPSPSLYLDIFQKIKALGFNTVSFYVDWALLEGKQGDFRAEGIFAVEPFLDAAKEAGLFLIARPGPYMNGEGSGGGFPGWLQQIPGILRTNDSSYLDSTDNYMSHIASLLAKYQITNDGPIILWQPENEYYTGDGVPFPNPDYFQYVMDQASREGIIVPFMNNDAYAAGNQAPDTGYGSADIYGFDSYPAGFNCDDPTAWPPGDYVWPVGGLATYWYAQHEQMSPTTPFSLPEFQGGAVQQYGNPGFDNCAILTNQEFERLFYKNNWASGVKIMNIYMTFGGSNWGYISFPGGYSSYDYGAPIRENRAIDREKYAELKLEAQFIKVSPDYLVANVGNVTTGVYSNASDISVTPLLGNGTANFFVIRHTDYTSTNTSYYTLNLPSSAGQMTIPRLGGHLTLNGRDSKVHVSDYPLGEYTLVYSTAEIFTWKKFGDKTIVILYGGPDEMHEVCVKGDEKITTHEGPSLRVQRNTDNVTFQWNTSPTRQVIQYGNLVIYLLDRNTAYNYWVPVLPDDDNPSGPQYGSSVMNPNAVIVNGGYLVRSATIQGSALSLSVDFNVTSRLEVIGAPAGTSKLLINGRETSYSTSSLGNWVTGPKGGTPKLNIPDLSKANWHYLDSLPEIGADYDDSDWPDANLIHTLNSANPLQTPMSLYGGDYGFFTGTLVFRGHFTASGKEDNLTLLTQGGASYASSVWLNDTLLGSYDGSAAVSNQNNTYPVSQLQRGGKYVITVIVENTGLEENGVPGSEQMKTPRGILDYALQTSSSNQTNISWKITGNLQGEDYVDKFRGPLNEGGLYFERQGYHLPGAPLTSFSQGSPFKGIDQAGVAFYGANVPLYLPAQEYDIPLALSFDNSTATAPYRALLFVNGFQFGRYVQNMTPQTVFPVPEGILNYNGDNWIGVAIWALDGEGAKLSGLTLEADTPVLTGRQQVNLVDGQGYRFQRRPNAY